MGAWLTEQHRIPDESATAEDQMNSDPTEES
jgi:endogenous inhibitor of DNA gyrase (YacG/DUF329 family)